MKNILTATVLFALFLTVGCQENEIFQNNSSRNPTNSQRNPAIKLVSNPELTSYRQKAESILHQSLASNDGIIVAHAIEVVNETNRKDLMPVIVRLLKDEAVAIRFTAAMTIGDMNYKPGALSVKPLLKDSNINVQIAAAYTLTELRKENLDSVIIEQLRNPNQTIRANAALLLGKLRKKSAHAKLKWVLNDKDSDELVRIQATESLAMLGVDKKRTYRRLWTLLVSKFLDDKISGIRGMRILGTKDARTAISTMLSDEILEIRLVAAEQLAIMSDFSGKNEVINYFTNVRQQLDARSRERADMLATPAIGRIGGPELEKHIPMLLSSRNKDIQLRAAKAVLMLTK